MARLNNVKRIITEDFEKEYQGLISRLGYVLNEFMSDTADIINGNIDFDNLSQNLLEFEITVDATGKPLKSLAVNVDKINPNGLQVIKAQNITNSTGYPTTAPFISFTPQGNNIITITNVSGLRANNKYLLTVVVY